MKLTKDEIAAAAFSQFGIVADDNEVNAFAEWLLAQENDIVTVEPGTIQQRTEQLIRDAESMGMVVTISLHPLTPLRMGNYQMRGEYRLKLVRYPEPVIAPAQGPVGWPDLPRKGDES